MTNGQKMVWAAAFALKLNDCNDSSWAWAYQLSNPTEKEVIKALRELAVKATEFADLAVTAMNRAEKELRHKKETDTKQYKRLLEMELRP